MKLIEFRARLDLFLRLASPYVPLELQRKLLDQRVLVPPIALLKPKRRLA